MAGGGGGTMYHQDLAYFDRGAPPMGPRFGGGGVGAMGGRMEPPPAPPQDNKNNFVREWVEVRLFFSHFCGNYELILLFLFKNILKDSILIFWEDNKLTIRN